MSAVRRVPAQGGPLRRHRVRPDRAGRTATSSTGSTSGRGRSSGSAPPTRACPAGLATRSPRTRTRPPPRTGGGSSSSSAPRASTLRPRTAGSSGRRTSGPSTPAYLRGARRAVGRRQLAGHPRGRRLPAVRRPQRPVPRRLRPRHRQGALAHAARRTCPPGARRPSTRRTDGRVLVVNGWKHIGGYDAKTGKEIWKLRGGGDIPVPAPVVAHGLVFITNAHGPASPIYAVRLGARGDITLPEGKTASEHVAWSVMRGGGYMQTPLVYGENLYTCRDNGVLTCYRARPGSGSTRSGWAAGARASRPPRSRRTASSTSRARKATSTSCARPTRSSSWRRTPSARSRWRRPRSRRGGSSSARRATWWRWDGRGRPPRRFRTRRPSVTRRRASGRTACPAPPPGARRGGCGRARRGRRPSPPGSSRRRRPRSARR